MDQLVSYLRERLILDFGGSLDLAVVRDLLRGEPDKDARKLLVRLVRDGGVDEMLLVLADCLADSARDALDNATILQQLSTYSES